MKNIIKFLHKHREYGMAASVFLVVMFTVIALVSTKAEINTTANLIASAPVATGDPAVDCANTGGSWNVSANYCDFSGSTGVYPSGSGSTDPAATCASTGGSWNASGNYCDFSNNSGGTYPASDGGTCPSDAVSKLGDGCHMCGDNDIWMNMDHDKYIKMSDSSYTVIQCSTTSVNGCSGSTNNSTYSPSSSGTSGGGTCPSSASSKLGSGCHVCGDNTIWMNDMHDKYIKMNDSSYTILDCSTNSVSGCTNNTSGGMMSMDMCTSMMGQDTYNCGPNMNQSCNPTNMLPCTSAEIQQMASMANMGPCGGSGQPACNSTPGPMCACKMSTDTCSDSSKLSWFNSLPQCPFSGSSGSTGTTTTNTTTTPTTTNTTTTTTTTTTTPTTTTTVPNTTCPSGTYYCPASGITVSGTYCHLTPCGQTTTTPAVTYPSATTGPSAPSMNFDKVASQRTVCYHKALSGSALVKCGIYGCIFPDDTFTVFQDNVNNQQYCFYSTGARSACPTPKTAGGPLHETACLRYDGTPNTVDKVEDYQPTTTPVVQPVNTYPVTPSQYTTEATCKAAAYFWYNNVCNTIAPVQTDLPFKPMPYYPVMGSGECPSDIKKVLDPNGMEGCHLCGPKQDRYFNDMHTKYVLKGATTLKICSTSNEDQMNGCTMGGNGYGPMMGPGYMDPSMNNYGPTPSSDCPSAVSSKLGNGCHTCGDGTVWMNMSHDQYIIKTDTSNTVVKCSDKLNKGCTVASYDGRNDFQRVQGPSYDYRQDTSWGYADDSKNTNINDFGQSRQDAEKAGLKNWISNMERMIKDMGSWSKGGPNGGSGSQITMPEKAKAILTKMDSKLTLAKGYLATDKLEAARDELEDIQDLQYDFEDEMDAVKDEMEYEHMQKELDFTKKEIESMQKNLKSTDKNYAVCTKHAKDGLDLIAKLKVAFTKKDYTTVETLKLKMFSLGQVAGLQCKNAGFSNKADTKSFNDVYIDSDYRGISQDIIDQISADVAKRVLTRIKDDSNIVNELLKNVAAFDDKAMEANVARTLETVAVADKTYQQDILSNKSALLERIAALESKVNILEAKLASEVAKYEAVKNDIAKYNFTGTAGVTIQAKLKEFDTFVTSAEANKVTKEEFASKVKTLQEETTKAKVLARDDKFKKGIIGFKDADDTEWYSGVALQAKNYGFVKGVDEDGTQFNPSAETNVAELVTMMGRATGTVTAGAKPTSSLGKRLPDWAQASAAALEDKGVNLDKVFGGKNASDSVERTKVAVLIKDVFKLNAGEASDKNFPDIAKATSAEKDAIGAVNAAGIMTGEGDGNFNANGKLNRAGMVKVLVQAKAQADAATATTTGVITSSTGTTPTVDTTTK